MPFKSQGNSIVFSKKETFFFENHQKGVKLPHISDSPQAIDYRLERISQALYFILICLLHQVFNLFVLAGSSSTTGTTMLATSEISLTAATATSPVANTVGEAATVVLAEGVANLKRPTTLALKCKSTPRNPKCNFLLSSSKCLYHNTKVDKKRNIFVRLTSLGKEKNVITSVALKTSVTRSQR